MSQSTSDRINDIFNKDIEEYIKKLDQEYNAEYPDTWIKDIVLDNLQGSDTALDKAVRELKTWFASKNTGSVPVIRANPRTYFRGKLIHVDPQKIRELAANGEVEIPTADIRKMKLITKDEYEYRPSSGVKVKQFTGSCSDSQYENEEECVEKGLEWNEDNADVRYLGITMDTMSKPLAIISMSIDKLKYGKETTHIILDNKIKTYEYAKILATTVTDPSADLNDLAKADDYLPNTLQLGNYFSPTVPETGENTLEDIGQIIKDSTRQLQLDYMFTLKDTISSSRDLLAEQVITKQTMCCLFIAFLNANPKSKEAISWDYTEVDEFLKDNEKTLRKLKIALEFILNWVYHKVDVALQPLVFNLIAIITNALFMALSCSLREAQSMTISTITDFIQQEKQKLLDDVRNRIAEGKGNDAYKTAEAALRCLPLEKVVILMVRSLIGKDSIFNDLIAMLSRINAYFKKKATETTQDLLSANIQTRGIAGAPYLKAAIEIIDFLLNLNTEGLMICDKYDYNNVSNIDPNEQDKLVDCMYPNGFVSTIPQSLCEEQCGSDCIQDCESICPPGQMCVNGSCVDASCNPVCPDGQICVNGECTDGDTPSAGGEDNLSTAFDPLMPGYSPVDSLANDSLLSHSYDPNVNYGGRIDITGEGIDPLRLLVLQDSNEISKFFVSYLGVGHLQAAELTANAKKGTCLDGLDSDQKDNITELLKEVGIDL